MSIIDVRVTKNDRDSVVEVGLEIHIKVEFTFSLDLCASSVALAMVVVRPISRSRHPSSDRYGCDPSRRAGARGRAGGGA